MRYESTRGSAPVLSFADALLGGLAPDGGLYVPQEWPDLAPAFERTVADPHRAYADVAVDVMAPFVGNDVAFDDLAAMATAAYSCFDHPDVVPVRRLDGDRWLAELFWGPTLAFKDVAMQMVGRLFDHVLERRGRRVTIVVATSGDTGSAAIEACRDRSSIDIVVLHPAGRVSEVQRRQMTTVDAPNVHNVAIDGTFDDCQDLVKGMFADESFRSDVRLSAMNSINWARVMAQIVYYVTSAARVGGGLPVAFSVPTGNFGNIFAGEVARRGGVPIQHLIVGSNRNDILTRFFSTGTMTIEKVVPTTSPSMDIQVSSNLERLLYELSGRDGPLIAELLSRFREDGTVSVPPDLLEPAGEVFAAVSVDEDLTRRTIAATAAAGGGTLDPHTAVGVAAADACGPLPVPVICLATAHPAKFPDAVEAATGRRPALPDRLADLLDRPERMSELPADPVIVQDLVRSVASAA